MAGDGEDERPATRGEQAAERPDGYPGFDGREFRRVLGHYPTGVTVVTAACEHGPDGLTIGSFSSVSLDPPLVSFCPGHDSESWARMRDAGSFCVNVLGEDQSGISTAFASKSDNRFEGVRTRVEASGSPVIQGCLAWIDCRTEAVHSFGDHDIVIGRVIALGVDGRDDEAAVGPLVFFKGRYGRLSEL